MEEKKYTLEIEDLVVQYKTDDGVVEAVNGISLKIEQGKTMGLVGGRDRRRQDDYRTFCAASDPGPSGKGYPGKY